ncbi:MAG TPA: hypothetical protein VGM51_06790 [Armatimonadota bacterium]|jgi:hypothetical protein
MPDLISLIVEHEVPGRIRLQCVGLKGNPSLAESIASMADVLPGIEGVSIRAMTGSVVFQYSLEETSPHHFVESLRRHAHVRRRPHAARPPEMPVGAEMIHAVRRFWTHADHRLAGASSGKVDLRSTLPWLFMFVGMRQLAINPDVAALPWYTAFYHSVQTIFMFRDETEPNAPEDDALLEELAVLTEGE